MPNHTDTTFITNEEGQTLLKRFEKLIKSTKFFDVLVGYFYTSGFYALYNSLEETEKIRILVGINTNRETLDLINQARQQELQFSHAETKKEFSNQLVGEMENSEDSQKVEEGIAKFQEWLQSGKLELRAYPSQNIHAKLYIMSLDDSGLDVGRVITGSSNFTQAGLVDNFEFNVELKNRADYDFAKEKFEELWEDAVDLNETYIDTIQNKTWLNTNINPYELYLKFLYEYFKDELQQADDVFLPHLPEEFINLEYQRQAVQNAKKILEAYGGVFISDVVGLGKTYVSAMLAQQLYGRTLVLAPPVLLDANNPGSWTNVFSDFNIPADHESLGKLDQLINRGTEKYDNVFIDEAHRFRNEASPTYEKLAQICRGKKVVLVTATPLNNTPNDILSQIKLFQNPKRSTIPNVPDLEAFFSDLNRKIKNLDRQKDHDKYMQTAKENARKIRESILKYLMVRRTRKEIENYFSDDLKNQGFNFPEVRNPESLFYELNERENEIFNQTIQIISKDFTYARYKAMLYYRGRDKLNQLERQTHENMGRFMRILLIKRLESSFHAFRNSVNRFISYYSQFLKELEAGNVYVSKKYSQKIFDCLENGDDEEIQKLLDEDKAIRYPTEDFSDELKMDLESDLQSLEKIQALWGDIGRDPKLLSFVNILSTNSVLKEKSNKLIVFTESKETANYLASSLENEFPGEILTFTGGASISTREKVIENFDARARSPRNDYRILIATEVLAEGVNLHRSNVVINYDIPWNPTRLMQRVGRINRVDTEFNEIYTFNFFPTEQSNDQIKLNEAAEAKIRAFITLLGSDAKLLTDGEDIESHELFDRLASKKIITGEDDEEESELKYLQIIREIRDNDPDLFEQIKRLPKKARTAKKYTGKENQLLTYFRKGKLQKFFIANNEIKRDQSNEVDFISAAGLLEAKVDTPREKLPSDFYAKLEENKAEFKLATTEYLEPQSHRGGRDSGMELLKFLKAKTDFRQYTDEQEEYYTLILQRLEDGALPKNTTKTTFAALKKEFEKGGLTQLDILAILQQNISDKFLESHYAEKTTHTSGPREVILSEYLVSK